MSRRVYVKPGLTWAMERRTTRRHYLLTPDVQGEVTRIAKYLLAYYCQKFGMRLHAVCVMSTHIHYVVTDVRGVRPKFKEEFHRVFALCLKALRGWPEEVWSKAATSERVLLNAEAEAHAIAYAIANPVAAGAVRYHQDWPGLTTRPADLGTRTERVRRPDAFLRDKERFPEELELTFELPARLAADYGEERARELVARRVELLEQRALEESRRTGIPFLGVRRVLRLSFRKRAKSYEAFGTLNPRFAAAGDRDAAHAFVAMMRAFNAAYDRALALWQAGKRASALFPAGTWWMVVHHRARVFPGP
ncbi:MAG: transposase [Myxococcota bacterium]